ncbi:MAG: DUF3568 family protein [Deltaproteobacteria bacterium]|nr:DUF3568 family protein [Deltaproteobacteria bacterium]MBW2071582.1 DUF3568 family protein [Deltaproteobacteria bacterium]
MRLNEMRLVACLCCLLIAGSGCAVLLAGAAGAGLGVGAYSYIEGNLKRDYAGPFPRVWNATEQALEQLEIPATVENKDAFGGLVKGIMHDGTKVTIKLKKKSESLTEVAVRVGLFGDREKSYRIQETITELFRRPPK